MRTPRIIDFTAQLLEAAAHPAIARIEPLEDPGTWLNPCGLRITMTDGHVVCLKMTRTAGDSGEDFSVPEDVVEFEIPREALRAAAGAAART